MAAYISFQPSEYFNTKIYTQSGGANNGATQTISLADVAFTWIKNRDYTNSHCLFDTTRGGNGSTCVLHSNTSAAAQGSDIDSSEGLTFGASSTTIGTDGGGYGYNNRDGDKYVSWSWRGGTTTGITTNGSTTITPSSYNFNQTAGFSVVQYTGNDTAGAKVAHGLGAAPKLILVKSVGSSNAWNVYHASLGATKYLILNETDAAATNTNRWNDTVPDSVNFTLGSTGATNGSGGDSPFVAYCFAEKKGYSHIGKYKGSPASTDGPFIYTGFRPAFVVIKAPTQTTNWIISDSKREGYNVDNDPLYTDVNVAEGTANNLDLLSNGFKIRNGSGSGAVNEINTDGEDYIYFAFSESPLVSSNSKAGTAR